MSSAKINTVATLASSEDNQKVFHKGNTFDPVF